MGVYQIREFKDIEENEGVFCKKISGTWANAKGNQGCIIRKCLSLFLQ